MRESWLVSKVDDVMPDAEEAIEAKTAEVFARFEAT